MIMVTFIAQCVTCSVLCTVISVKYAKSNDRRCGACSDQSTSSLMLVANTTVPGGHQSVRRRGVIPISNNLESSDIDSTV
jgi:hypothetical protein